MTRAQSSRKSNLARFNAERSSHVIPAIKHELERCRRGHLQFPSVGLLAAYLSTQVRVDRSTLIRNRAYRELLVVYVASQPGAVETVSDATDDVAVLQAKLAAAKSKIVALSAQCKQLEGRLAEIGVGLGGTVRDTHYAQLAMVLVAVLNRFPEFLKLDRSRRELVDLSARKSEQVIAGAARIGKFLELVETNSALPEVRKLLVPTHAGPPTRT